MTTNYRLARTHLINAFLAFEGDSPEVERLRRTTELLMEAVVADLPRFISQVYNASRLRSALSYPCPQQFEDQHVGLKVKTAA